MLSALVLGLVASLSWGVADFIDGVEARRLPVLSVLLVSQRVGLSAAAVWAFSAGGVPPPLVDLAVAAAAGVAGALALGALWEAMARGMIGLASPISATGVLVPVIYGLARGESPSLLQLVAASLYPAVTVILGARVLHERLGRGQRAGVLVALIGIAAIAAGS